MIAVEQSILSGMNSLRGKLYRCFIICVMLTVNVSCLKEKLTVISEDYYQYKEDSDDVFIFYTDAHFNNIPGGTYRKYMNRLYDYYNILDVDFCINCGDWLNDNDTYDEACVKLDFICNDVYDLYGLNHLLVLGNHDTNYQGRKDNGSEANTGRISNDVIRSLFFKNFENNYYLFRSNSAAFYVLDTGLDWEYNMSEYRWEQIHWLAQNLQYNTDKHIIIVLHIFYNNMSELQQLALNSMNVAESYNCRESIIINDKKYDFTNTSGNVACFLCGHSHADYVDNSYSIPIVCTRNFQADGMPTFDICQIDWDINKMRLFRVGSGESRIVELSKNPS